MLFTQEWLSTIFSKYRAIHKNQSIDIVFIDSREKVVNGLFIPIVGDRLDGHEFTRQAIDNGATAILWEKEKNLPKDLPKDVAVFFVEDTTKALQQLAYEYKLFINPKVIGITGSNGKTTTKDLVATVVRSTYNTHFTDGNFNNHIGLPLTILAMPHHTEVLVLEMGMNAFGEIDLLSKIAEPNISVITNIGESHIEFLGNKEGIAKAKLEIRNGMSSDGTLIIDGDEDQLSLIAKNNNVITCGFNDTNNVKIKDVTKNLQTTTFTVNETEKYQIPLLGIHHAKNATFAITIGKLLNIPYEKIQSSLENLAISSMRFEFITGKNNVTIVNDAYNASPTSMIGAINVVSSLSEFKNRVLVLGDIFELGPHAEKFHEQVGKSVSKPITAVFTYGKLAKVIAQTVVKQEANIIAKHAQSEEQLLTLLKPYLNEDSIILFKASRGMAFEKFVEQLKV